MDGGGEESVVDDVLEVLMGNVHMIYSNLMDGEFRGTAGWVVERRLLGVVGGVGCVMVGYSTVWHGLMDPSSSKKL